MPSWTTTLPSNRYETPDTGAHTGLYSLRLLSGSSSRDFEQTIACTAGIAYTVTGFYKIDVDLQQTGNVGVVLNGAIVAQRTLSLASAWTSFSLSFTPATCSGGLAIFIAGNVTGLANGTLCQGTVWFDDLSVTAGGGNLVSNPGFEMATVANWTLSQARPTGQKAHEASGSILITGQGGNAVQRVFGGIPSTSYVVTAYCFIQSSNMTATLNLGGTSWTSTVAGSWQAIMGSGTTDGAGNLLITLSATATSGVPVVYFDDVVMSPGNPENTAVSWGQQFQYDGFGNLLAETPTPGPAPMLSINVDTSTNHVVATGVQYDSAGNMINDGSQSYGFDEVNRLKTAGTYSYTYSGLENKRVIAYNSYGSTPSATINLYGPDGKRLGYYRFSSNNGWSTATSGTFQNYLYLGSKSLSYAEDRIGSNGNYFPYGNGYVASGAEVPTFATYVQDESGLLYADQRYYHANFGRFMTADRSNANIDYRNPISWNRYGYANGDPVNGMDPSGLEDWDYDGFSCFAGGGGGGVDTFSGVGFFCRMMDRLISLF